MSETWVVNASPVIALAKIGRLDFLQGPERVVLIPGPVADEILAGPAADPAAVAMTDRAWADVVPTVIRAEVLQWGLGAGETAVLSLALDRGATAVLDDREARAAARTFRVHLIGTLGVVLQARRDGRIASAASVLAELRRAGLRLNDTLIREALRQFAGEEWEA